MQGEKIDLGGRGVSVKIQFSPCEGLHNLLKGNCKYLSNCYVGYHMYVHTTDCDLIFSKNSEMKQYIKLKFILLF